MRASTYTLATFGLFASVFFKVKQSAAVLRDAGEITRKSWRVIKLALGPSPSHFGPGVVYDSRAVLPCGSDYEELKGSKEEDNARSQGAAPTM